MALSETQRQRYQNLKQRGYGGNRNLKSKRATDPYGVVKEQFKRTAVKEINKNGQQSILRGNQNTFEENNRRVNMQKRNARTFYREDSDTRERLVRGNLFAGARQISKDSSTTGQTMDPKVRYKMQRYYKGMSVG